MVDERHLLARGKDTFLCGPPNSSRPALFEVFFFFWSGVQHLLVLKKKSDLVQCVHMRLKIYCTYRITSQLDNP